MKNKITNTHNGFVELKEEVAGVKEVVAQLLEVQKKNWKYDIIIWSRTLLIILLLIGFSLRIHYFIGDNNSTITTESNPLLNFDTPMADTKTRSSQPTSNIHVKKPTKVVIIYSNERSSSTTMMTSTLLGYAYNGHEILGDGHSLNNMIWNELPYKGKRKSIQNNGRAILEMSHNLYDILGVPIMYKLFPYFMYPNESKIVLQDEHTCVVKLQRDFSDRYCSRFYAELTHDWGHNPKEHAKNVKLMKLNDRNSFDCDAEMKKNPIKKKNFEGVYIQDQRWFQDGEPFYDVEITFKEHVANSERSARRIAEACGLKKGEAITRGQWRKLVSQRNTGKANRGN